MNIRTVLLTPWRAAHPSLRWLSLGLLGLCLAGAIAFDVAMPGGKGARISLLLYSGAVGFMWAFYMPASFLLAYDARLLRVPALERTAIAGIALCALGTIIIGAALAGQQLGFTVTTAITALVMTAGFAFSLLPHYLSTFLGLMPAMGQFLQRMIPAIPGLSDPRAAAWYGSLALVFALACGLRWRQLMSGSAEKSRLSGTMVMQMRSNGGMGNWGRTRQPGSSQGIRQSPAWLQPEADLRHTGPASPVVSLRVALGGWFVPQTWRGRWRQILAVAWPIGMFALLTVATRAGEKHPENWKNLLEVIALGLGGVLCLTVSLGAPLIGALMLRQRWSTPQRELALLAVLPGLGSAKQARRALLQAALALPLGVNLVLAIVAACVATALHLGALASLAVIAGPLLCAAAGIALSLDALGSKPLAGWALGIVRCVLTIVVFSSGFTALLASQLRQGGAWVMSPGLWSMFSGMVALLVVLLFWVGRRGARALLAQPHPFLSHA